ncbi:MAG: hypothetical protein AB7H96_18640 [Vicinamibacterales bacterium]
MTPRRFAEGVLLVLLGTGLVGGSYWGLLNVPESTVLALVLSALLATLTVLLIGLTNAVVLAHFAGTPLRRSVLHAARRLPAFLLGLAAFTAVWWFTSFVEAQWTLHNGEIDALFLRHAGTANTGWMHASVDWAMWLLRWVLGVAVVEALTAGQPGLALSGRTLGALVLALIAATGIAKAASWRPDGLPPATAELIFVGVKLGALAVASAIVAAGVLAVFARAARPRPSAPAGPGRP